MRLSCSSNLHDREGRVPSQCVFVFDEPLASNRSANTVTLFTGLDMWHCCLSTILTQGVGWGWGGVGGWGVGKSSKESINNKGFYMIRASCGLTCACVSAITEAAGTHAARWTGRCIIHTRLTLSVLSFLAGQPPSTGCSM